MAKDKKKKKDKKKDQAGGNVVSTLKTLGSSALVADVVAAALVATAAALKDPNKARRFASEAGDQLEKMTKDGAERGGAMWQLALDVGRRALDAMANESKPKPKSKGAKTKGATARPKSVVAKARAKPTTKARAKPAAKRTPRKA